MKRTLIIILAILCFFSAVLLIEKPFTNEVDENSFKSGFRLIIIGMTKSARNYDKITLSDGKTHIIVIDRLRREKNYQINIGDSLIKEKNSCIYYYKRKDSVIYYAKEACKNIFILPR